MRALAVRARLRKRNIRADLAREPIGRADGLVSIIPTRLRGQRHRDVRQPHAGPDVAVRVDRRYADDERRADFWRLDADNALVPIGTEIQMERAKRLLWQLV